MAGRHGDTTAGMTADISAVSARAAIPNCPWHFVIAANRNSTVITVPAGGQEAGAVPGGTSGSRAILPIFKSRKTEVQNLTASSA
jgi:hypothetical protein